MINSVSFHLNFTVCTRELKTILIALVHVQRRSENVSNAEEPVADIAIFTTFQKGENRPVGAYFILD